jgi:hypothetical protein
MGICTVDIGGEVSLLVFVPKMEKIFNIAYLLLKHLLKDKIGDISFVGFKLVQTLISRRC